MKKIKLLLVLVMLSAMMIACSKDDLTDKADKYSMSNLPSKFKGDIPASITGDSSQKSSGRLVRKSILRTKSTGSSNGCSQIKEMTTMLSYDFQSVAMMAVVADAALSQNNITADGNAHDGSVTLTKEMVAAMKEVIGGTEDLSFLDEAIGETISATITFRDDLTPTTDAPYNCSVSLVTADAESGSGVNTFYWSSDKKSTRLVSDFDDEYYMDIIYNDTTKYTKSQYDDETEGYHSLFTIQETGENGGSVFYSSNKSSSDTLSYSYLLEGFADDDGGFIKTTYTSGADSYSNEESFDVDGNIISDDSTYTGYYQDNAEIATSFMTDMGIGVTVSSFTEGQHYLVSNGGEANWGTMDNIIGMGFVTDGKFYIQDIGGLYYSSFEENSTATGTFFASEITTGTDGLISYSTAVSVSYTK